MILYCFSVFSSNRQLSKLSAGILGVGLVYLFFASIFSTNRLGLNDHFTVSNIVKATVFGFLGLITAPVSKLSHGPSFQNQPWWSQMTVKVAQDLYFRKLLTISVKVSFAPGLSCVAL